MGGAVSKEPELRVFIRAATEPVIHYEQTSACGRAGCFCQRCGCAFAPDICCRSAVSESEQYWLGADRRGPNGGWDAGRGGDIIQPRYDAADSSEGEERNRGAASI